MSPDIKEDQTSCVTLFLSLFISKSVDSCGLMNDCRLRCLRLARVEGPGGEQDACCSVGLCVGKSDTEKQTRSSDTAGLVRNVTDSVGGRGIDSSPWLSHPRPLPHSHSKQ